MGGFLSSWALVLSISLLAWGSVEVFNAKPEWSRDHMMLGLVASGLMVVLFCISLGGLKLIGVKGPLLITGFFLFTCWSATCDTFISMALVGWYNAAKFYVVTGEEYFKTPWGFACLFYDGTVHWFLQAVCCVALIRGKNMTLPGLVWSGSVINSMPVLLLGASTGQFSADIKLATALNLPYIFAPLAIAVYCFNQKRPTGGNKSSVGSSSIFEVLFFIFHVTAFVIHIVRCVVVLDSKCRLARDYIKLEPVLAEESGFGKVQVLQNGLVLGYWHIFAAFESVHRLVTKRTSTLFLGDGYVMTKWSCFVAGVHLQTQFCYLSMVLFSWKNYSLGYNKNTNPWTISVNVLLLVFPLLQAFVYKTQSVDTSAKATKIKKK
mmetsp:Transcript_40703/g.65363  ORF Transcript_40703/g.65363 Transcript_40703/m.65363 type:complete len:378 (+) Transcript_40703:229-1362(+)|eukprot:CAMPEP_0203780472 /NCGR_PEP_ID=MMETSP0099_2-20121227/9479_1 /ASSEMBLY_ACC=CAM_ASM_000209 /TAXON_ID=96639 /ORGANISM=" , Strain NY0313808BC1" /LENGTH=377 /DNA_ID=CAMNT_0050680911 /DNA_START=12 /DNA_END=1145 /DNA_ORIENTATION=-